MYNPLYITNPELLSFFLDIIIVFSSFSFFFYFSIIINSYFIIPYI
jgi:hypothetical protein